MITTSASFIAMSAVGLGWLAFGLGLFAGMTIVLIAVNIRRVVKEDSTRR